MTRQEIIIWLAVIALLAVAWLFVYPFAANEELVWILFVLGLLTILHPYLVWKWMRERRGGRRGWAGSRDVPPIKEKICLATAPE